MKKNQSQAIQIYLLKQISKHPKDIVAKACAHFKVTRTTVLRHMHYLIERGQVIKTGNTRQSHYVLADAMQRQFIFPIDTKFEEFELHQQYVVPFVQQYVNQNAADILEYVVTEMLNNCKDHANASRVKLAITVDGRYIDVTIEDDGIGALANLGQALDIQDPREVILELSKGKMTSDPNNHTGEGIFFSSRACDQFSLSANGYCYLRDNQINDWQFVSTDFNQGTQFHFLIDRKTQTDLTHIFAAYQNDESLSFNTTEVVVALSKLQGERLISRSQAKRVARHLDQFERVILDFSHVRTIGQGFVDELFRVYQNQRPHLQFTYQNAHADVRFMIERGRPK